MTHVEQCSVSVIHQSCEPYTGDTTPLSSDELADLLSSLGSGWRVAYGHHLSCEYDFDNFKTALDFTNDVGELADQEGHHPKITLSFGKVELSLFTPSVDGLTRDDFLLASKIVDLRPPRKTR